MANGDLARTCSPASIKASDACGSITLIFSILIGLIPKPRSRRRWEHLIKRSARGKALYAGISNYQPADARKAAALLRSLGTPCLIHQPSYSMLNRWIEDGLTAVLEEEGIGCIVFSPLAQGQLTGRYLREIPADSRAARGGFLKAESSPQ